MGRFYFHFTEAVWEVIAREEWLGCRHVVAHVGHTRVNTSVGSTYFISGFLFYKIYICIYTLCFQIKYLYSIKQKHWWSLALSWPDEVQRMFFDRPLILKIK